MKSKMDQFSVNLNPMLSVARDGTVLYSNEASEPLLQEWGTRIGEKLPSRIVDIAQSVISRNSPVKIEVKVGNKLYLVVFSSLPEEQLVSISGFDISDQKGFEKDMASEVREKAERDKLVEELGRSEEKYHTLFEIIDEGFCVIEVLYDEADCPIDYRFLEINAAFERQTGIKNAVGRRMREIAPEHEEHWFQIYGNVALTGEPVRFENPALALGRYYDVYAFRIGDPEQRRVGILFNDISRRKRAEEALRKSEEEYRHLVEYAPTAIYEIDYSGPRFKRVNDAMCEILGYTREELIAKNPLDLMDPESRVRFLDRTRRVLAGEPVDESVAFRVFTKNGREIWTELNVKLQYKDGKLDGALVVAHDITKRKRVEEALRESENLFRTLFEYTDDAFQIVELIFENGKVSDFRYLQTNAAFENQSGLKSSEVEGKTVKEILPNVEPHWFEMYGRVIKEGRPLRDVSYNQDTKRWYEMFYFPYGEGKVGVLFRDITDKKQAEEALRESEELYRALFENTRDGFVLVEPIFDETGNSDDYRMLKVNDAWERQTGLRAADFVEKRIRETMPDVEHIWPAAFAGVARTGTAKHFESYNAVSGQWYDLHIFPYRTGQVGVLFRDITKRKQAEEALRKSEEHFRAFVTASSEIVYRMSPDWTEMRHLEGKEFIPDTDSPDSTWLDIYIHPENQPHVLEVINEAIRTKSTFELEHLVLRVDGTLGWTRSRSIPMLDEKGEITEWFGTASDITELKRAEEAQRENSRIVAEAVEIERKRLFDMLETLPVMVCLMTPDYHVAYANQTFRDKFGESHGRRCYEYCCGFKEPCGFCQSFKPLETGQPHHWEFTSPDGSTIIDAYDFAFTDVDGSPMILEMDIDITERKRAEEALLEKTKQLEEANCQKIDILESISDCFYALDKDLRFVYVNNTAEKIWNLSRADLIGRKIEDVFPGLIDISMSKFHQVLEEQVPQHYEVYSNVIHRWGDMNVYPTQDGISVYFHDITERKWAEEALQEREEREAYLLRLSDALRPLSDVQAIQDATTRLLADYLGASQSNYTEYLEEYSVVSRESLNDASISIVGSYRLSDFPVTMATLYSGRDLVIPDIAVFPAFSAEERAQFLARNVHANATVPLIKEGKLIATLTVRQTTPRNWTPDEVELIRETAERTWSAVGRARAERTLHESELKYRTLSSTLEEKVKERAEELEKAYNSLKQIDIVRKQEIHHRIKNNLQVISSLLDLQAEKFRGKNNIEDSQVLEAFKESQDRVISMALIHEELHKGGQIDTLNFSQYIEELADNLFLTYKFGSDGVILDMDIEENIFFDMDTSIPLGMIINELVSNSLKHAFSGREKEEIKIKLHREENEECIKSISEDCKSTNFTLTISDNGVGIPEGLDIEGLDSLGFQLVISLVDQLDGDFELKRINGTEFTMKFTVIEKDNQASTTAPKLIE